MNLMTLLVNKRDLAVLEKQKYWCAFVLSVLEEKLTVPIVFFFLMVHDKG